MIIFRSSKPNLITQWFGQNKLSIYKEWGMKGHNGIDFAMPSGTSLYWDCSNKGVVYKKETDSSGGIGLDIISKDEDTDQFYKHRFWHLKGYAVEVGDIVETGDLIAYADNTGISTGSHLHRGLKPVNMGVSGRYYNELQSNGYFGAIDIRPFFKNVFVVDYVKNLNGQLSILKKLVYLFEELVDMMRNKISK